MRTENEAAIIVGEAITLADEGQKLALLSSTQESFRIPSKEEGKPPLEIPTKKAAIDRLVRARQQLDKAIERLGA